MLTDFQNSFTGRLSGEFVANHIQTSHHTLTMLLHYIVKYLCSKNRHSQELIEANCHVRLSHSKTLLKHLSDKVFIILLSRYR